MTASRTGPTRRFAAHGKAVLCRKCSGFASKNVPCRQSRETRPFRAAQSQKPLQQHKAAQRVDAAGQTGQKKGIFTQTAGEIQLGRRTGKAPGIQGNAPHEAGHCFGFAGAPNHDVKNI